MEVGGIGMRMSGREGREASSRTQVGQLSVARERDALELAAIPPALVLVL